MGIDDFRTWDEHIIQVEEVEKSKILKKVNIQDKSEESKRIVASMPNFYSIRLDSYLTNFALKKVKHNLEKSESIIRVETFASVHQSKYELFSFIKLSFATFIIFMGIIGFFLIVKQMEVWNFLHAKRMQIMEIFGASLFLRSKVLIQMGLVDAILSSILTSGIFLSLQNLWIRDSNMDILKENVNEIFAVSDFFILLMASIAIVLVAIFLVVINVKEE
jgi:cell division transport system permease protein